MKDAKLFLLFVFLISLTACVVMPEQKSARTFVIGGKQITESVPGEFLSWTCNDYSDGGKTLVEVGKFPIEHLKRMVDANKKDSDLLSLVGFILYDGTNSGDITVYRRQGLSHRWDWKDESGSFSFVIDPTGKGLYYDFSTAKDGLKGTADGIYKCHT